MQSKSVSRREIILHMINNMFNTPLGHVDTLQRASVGQWLLPFGLGWVGYALFGLSMGTSGMSWLFAMPTIFGLGLFVSLPALYIFHAYLGARLRPKELAAIAVQAWFIPGLMLAGMAPINWFFAVTTPTQGWITVSQIGAILLVSYLSYSEVFQGLRQLEDEALEDQRRALTHRSQGAASSKTQKQTGGTRTWLLVGWLMLYFCVLYKFSKMFLIFNG